MKKRNFVLGFVVAFILLTIIASIVIYLVWINKLPSLEIRVDGLQDQDTANLQLFAELPQTKEQLSKRGITLPSKKVRNGNYNIIITNLPDAAYTLIISAPSQYYRNPAGYFLRMNNLKLTCSAKYTYHFILVPPSSQDLPPCRNIPTLPNLASTPSSPVEKIECRAEPVVDPCGPPVESRP